MTVNEDDRHPLFEAIDNADLVAIARLAASGADLNIRDSLGEPALFTAVARAEFSEDGEDRERRLEVIRKLVSLGADLNALDDEGGSILIRPIFGLNTGLVEWLLRLGVDPNHGCLEPMETVFDAAILDYDFEAWIVPGLPPLNPPNGPLGDADSYLAWLDQEAGKRGYLRPAIPLLLRRFGALACEEIAAKLGGTSGQGIKWTKGGWTLV